MFSLVLTILALCLKNMGLTKTATVSDKIAHYQSEILRWEDFKRKTTYFQSFAVENIERLTKKINELQQ
jgi:hypothetical protein